MNPNHRRALEWWGVSITLAIVAACSDDGSAPAPEPTGTAKPTQQGAVREAGSGSERNLDSPGPEAGSGAEATPDGACGAGEFDSTFAALQKIVFEQNSCTNAACHGIAAMGSLDLRADVAYDNLLEVRSENGSLFRVMPGEPDESFLYNKLRAATEPGSVLVEGSPMPSGAPPVRAEHLEAVRKWIEAGAPRDGSIGDGVTGSSESIAKLLGSCLPAATPVSISALEPPGQPEPRPGGDGPGRPGAVRQRRP